MPQQVLLALQKTEQAGQRPLLITGDRLHVLGAQGPNAAVTVTGQPAHFEGRGLALTGSNINLNRGTNRLWIDGPGQMDVPLDSDLEGRPTGNPGVLEVRWQDRMVFDGRTARFEESITATAPGRLLRTETLEVQFRERIRFADSKIQENPFVEKIRCLGDVTMESREFDELGQTSYERMEVVDLAINRTSGALTAGGPGWLNSVRYESDDPLGTGTGNAVDVAPVGSRADANTKANADKNQLRNLHVRFQGSITGNLHLHHRQMTFHDRVTTSYAPVDSFNAMPDTTDPEVLGPGSVVMFCDRLTVNEMITPAGKHRELEAAGNVVADGKREDGSFTARAVRMTYTQAKNLLLLEGDGRTDAVLSQQRQIGGRESKFAARRILYRPKSGQVGQLSAQGVRQMESSWLSPGHADSGQTAAADFRKTPLNTQTLPAGQNH